MYNNQPAFALQGQLDLVSTSFNKEKLIPLDGTWEFYESQLYDQEQFERGISKNPKYIEVPGTWSTEAEKSGSGTYRLVIQNVPTDQVLGIKKQNIRSASKIFINGKLVSEEGFVAKQQTNYTEGNIPKLIFFQPDKEQLEIIIQVTDFSYNSAGISNSIYFGEQDVLVSESFKHVIFELGILAILLTIGMLYIFLYLFVERYRRKEFFILAFALSCIFFALVNLCLSERTILYLIPSLSFEALFKIKDTSIFLATISLILIVTQIDQRLLNPLFKNVLIFVYTFYVLVILLTTLNFYHSFLPIFIVLNCFVYLYMMIKMLYFYFKKDVARDYQQKIIMFSMLNINIYNINLLLYSFGFTSKLQLGFLNILFYAIALAIYLTIRVNHSYKRNDLLTHELDVTEQAYLVAQIKPHFFFNTLTSVMSLCYSDGKKAAQLLSHFSSFLRQSFEFNSQEMYVSVEKEIKLLHSYIAIEQARFGEKLQIEFNVDPDALAESILPLSIQPLVENAINHGICPKEDFSIIRVSINKIHSHLVVTVYDTGVGIPSNKISELLGMSNQKERGIGIANINRRLTKYYDTQLIIESKLGSWTKVSFEIPLHS
ncbi:sensor histidine kinase [Solibacillus faecavium]|uniref:sensor histidine kinase n=1 Tax=Solibacillus faecavium TaxID=2762221 RepID=UPI00178066E1|nr:histidine kinase [Solibacillus faecavium]